MGSKVKLIKRGAVVYGWWGRSVKSKHMAQKELPTLAGHKLRTRKRDEKVKYDPGSFCVQLVAGINKAEGNLEDVSKYLDQASSSLDYRCVYVCVRVYLIISRLAGATRSRCSTF